MLTNHSPAPMMQVVVSNGNQNGEQPPVDEMPAGFEAVSLIEALNGDPRIGDDNAPKFAKPVPTSLAGGQQQLSVQLEASSCASLYESTNEEEEDHLDSIGGAENMVELASGAQLNLSKSSSIETGQETTKLLFKEQSECQDSIRN